MVIKMNRTNQMMQVVLSVVLAVLDALDGGASHTEDTVKYRRY